MVKDTGMILLKRTSLFNFKKWGEYMKRAQLAERKLEKLKSLILLTDPVVGHVEMNELTKIQWLEFIREFPDESSEDKI